MNKTRLFLFILTILFFVVACGQNAKTEIPYQVDGELPSSPAAREWIKDAAVDLAQELQVNVADVSFKAFELPVWPDASYGCPQASESYGSESKEGYKIQLQVNGRDYFYHGGEDIEQFLCETE